MFYLKMMTHDSPQCFYTDTDSIQNTEIKTYLSVVTDYVVILELQKKSTLKVFLSFRKSADVSYVSLRVVLLVKNYFTEY